jgi:hypothetical protein
MGNHAFRKLFGACDLVKSVFYYHSKTLDKPDICAEIKNEIDISPV